MKIFTFIFSYASLFTLLLSCSKDNIGYQLDENTALTFGEYHLECNSDCFNFFKIEDEELFKLDTVINPFGEMQFQETPLDNSKYETAKILFAEFPAELILTSKRRFGCPDCYDQGGFYIELNNGEEKEWWLLDVMDIEQSESIIEYKNKIEEILNQL